MAKRVTSVLPATQRLISNVGARLRLARLRRALTATQVAQRAGINPMTLRGVERGGTGVTIGAYAAVMQVLGMEQDLDLIGATDTLGRALQDSRLEPRNAHVVPRAPAVDSKPGHRRRTRVKGSDADAHSTKHSSFVSSADLSALIRVPRRTRR